jgi:hypothetical protein
MLFVTLACVALGVITIAPGIGAPLAVVAFFCWLRTVDVVHVRATRGLTATSRDKVRMFLRSFFSSILVLTLIGVVGGAALFLAFFTLCAVMEPGTSAVREAGPYAVAAVLSVAGAIFGIRKTIQFGRRRRRRDIGEPD